MSSSTMARSHPSKNAKFSSGVPAMCKRTLWKTPELWVRILTQITRNIHTPSWNFPNLSSAHGKLQEKEWWDLRGQISTKRLRDVAQRLNAKTWWTVTVGESRVPYGIFYNSKISCGTHLPMSFNLIRGGWCKTVRLGNSRYRVIFV